jgi:hypothetical protein
MSEPLRARTVPDLGGLLRSHHAADLWCEAQECWLQRYRTEYRSIQILTRFLTEVTGAGMPLEVQTTAADLVQDEIFHAALCAAMCRTLGVEPDGPKPLRLEEPPGFMAAPMFERAVGSAITMLLVNETLSVAFIRDLQERCHNLPVRSILEATLADESTHGEFGWDFVSGALPRFPHSACVQWRALAQAALRPHREAAERIVETIPTDRRTLAAWPDTDRVALGLFSPQRQALVAQQAIHEQLLPRLRRLELN